MRIKISDRVLHLVLAGVWVVLAIPTVVWWRDSILWVAFMSLYAIVGTHWSAYEAAKAKDIAEHAEEEAEKRE